MAKKRVGLTKPGGKRPYKGVSVQTKVSLGGSSTRKPKVNLSNTYGIKGSSSRNLASQSNTGAVTRGGGKNKHSRKSSLNKIRGN
jgi:hypothetical protein